jgi:signal transduction histidine kinase/DNA-binding response OmpR family regulator/ligand-binding sensor domain-containing protein
MHLFNRVLLGIFLLTPLIIHGRDQPFDSSGNLAKKDKGLKYYRNYSPKEYKNQSQNWCILQDKRGVIYVANQGGLMEFDGVSWREIRVPNSSVRSLAMDDKGKIYIGGRDEIGYLTHDSKGSLYYVSLLDHLDKTCRNFSNVWQAHSTKEGIFFRTSKYLFLCDLKQMKVWKSKTRFMASYSCNGTYFVQQEKVGLMQMKMGSLELIPGGERFAVEKLHMMNYYDSQGILLGTRLNGLFIYNGSTIMPFPTEVADYLKEKQLYHGIGLSCGDFALATLQGGLVIIDSNGNLKHIFDKTSGLQDDNSQFVFEDQQGNLWLALGKGISKIEYASPISLYNENRSNLPGIVLAVTRHGPHDNLYAGTDRGLYTVDLPTANKFRPVQGINSSCWFLLSIGDNLLAATSVGIFQVEKSTKRLVIKNPSYFLLPSGKMHHRIWVGTREGLISLYLKNSQWIKESKFENITEDIWTIAEDKKGNLWLGTLTKGVLNVDFQGSGSINNPVLKRYDTSHGLPPGEGHVFMAAGHVMFTTGKGIFRFDEKNKVFTPDDILGEEFAGGENGSGVFRLVEDKYKNIWMHSEARNIQAIPQPDGTFVINKKPFLSIPLAQVNCIYPDPYYDEDVIWFTSVDGLIRYDTKIEKNYDLSFHTLIREAVVKGMPLMYDAEKFKYKESKGGYWKDDFPVFPYKDRNLRFHFAAPFFEAETQTQYQCLLEGYDDDWTAWSQETWKDYTNLDPGSYTFRVQAKNVYGTFGSEGIFQFKVLPPWYKAWWAFVLYATAAALMIFLVVKWRSWKLVQEKQQLEQIILDRTKEIKNKNLQLLEQSKKLEELDKMKSHFFANISHEFRTPLTLITGPLEQMLTSPREDEREQKKKMRLMLRNSRRLLSLINQLLDLSKFDSGKMKLQASQQNIVPFLKGIVESFDSLAAQNELHLEFHTKEKDITLYFDGEKIEKAVCNLLINAIKFTPPAGKITVTLHVKKDISPGFLEISVGDTGTGIPLAQLEYIFDRFYQARGLKEHAHKGSGIGLALAKELVSLHHGEISVHSWEGKGSQFTIRLPLGDKHLESEEIVRHPGKPVKPEVPKEDPDLYLMEKEEEEVDQIDNRTIDQTIDEDLTLEKNIILVVEDNADVRTYIKSAIEPHYQMKEAKDGREGIEKALEIIPDLIISDVMMPGIDGYELCRVLKNDVKTSHIPVILLTARAAEDDIVEGLETGADDYITKPFNTRILCARIKNLIDLRRQWQQKIQRQMTLQPAEIPVSSVDETFIKDLQKLIEKNLSDELFSVEQLGKELYMSRATLYRKVLALTGEPPREFIKSYRLKRGAQLLKANFGNVTEVSVEVGFSSTAYFTKCFKEKFHQLPHAYQETHRKSGQGGAF